VGEGCAQGTQLYFLLVLHMVSPTLRFLWNTLT
jgi:hypothetical protein